MATDETCSGCAQKHDCKSIYGVLGNTKGPSVVRKVIFVFLFPLAVFIASIAGLEFFFKERIASELARTTAAFGLAALIAIASAGLVRWIVPAWGRPCQTDQDRNLQNGNTREKDI